MESWQYLLLGGLGIVAGIINVIAGGGSLLTLPAMILMAGMPAPVANGTNRVAILAQNLVAISTFRQKGFSDFKLSLTLALCTVPGAVAGAYCGALVRGELFNRILAGIMIGVVILMARKKKKNDMVAAPGEPVDRNRVLIGHACMIAVGFYGGFIQAGVGFLLMASLNKAMGLDLVRVNMHKVFIVATFTTVALAVFLITGNVRWLPGLALAAGNSIGGWIGSHLTISKGEVFVQRVLFVALLVMAAKLILG